MALVARPFRCKYTKKRYKPGETYEHPDPNRIEYLRDAGYLQAPPLLESPEASQTVAEHNEYELMTKKEIEELLKRRGIEHNRRQTKTELIELLKQRR